MFATEEEVQEVLKDAVSNVQRYYDGGLTQSNIVLFQKEFGCPFNSFDYDRKEMIFQIGLDYLYRLLNLCAEVNS